MCGAIRTKINSDYYVSSAVFGSLPIDDDEEHTICIEIQFCII